MQKVEIGDQKTKKVLQAPFPWFGGKFRVANLVWERFGDVRNYVEPFFGSGAMLLGRPLPFDGTETVNDADGLLANFWRALQADPDAVAHYADWPVNENDLHARHSWLVGQKEAIQSRLEGDADFFDAKVAGWWVWGICAWISGGWCSGKGPWKVRDIDGVPHLVRDGLDSAGVKRSRPPLGDAGMGVQRQLPHLGDAGNGVHRNLPHLGNAGSGVHRKLPLVEWMHELAARLRRVRVCCGDWSRVCGPSVTTKHGLTTVFLDPPYSAEAGRDANLYRVESLSVAHAVREWAIANGDNPLMRIALCGYEGEHSMPDSWECFTWKANGGMANQGQNRARDNAKRERIWFSPHCLKNIVTITQQNERQVFHRGAFVSSLANAAQAELPLFANAPEAP